MRRTTELSNGFVFDHFVVQLVHEMVQSPMIWFSWLRVALTTWSRFSMLNFACDLRRNIMKTMLDLCIFVLGILIAEFK